MEQKRYLLDFVFQNMVLNEEFLTLPLKQPFGAIQEMGKNKDWCRVRDSNPRTRRELIYSQPCLTASLTLHGFVCAIAIIKHVCTIRNDVRPNGVGKSKSFAFESH